MSGNINRVRYVLTYCQQLIRAVIAEQTEMTHLGLQFLQISANKNKAEQICKKQLEAQQKAAEAYSNGEDIRGFIRMALTPGSSGRGVPPAQARCDQQAQCQQTEAGLSRRRNACSIHRNGTGKSLGL